MLQRLTELLDHLSGLNEALKTDLYRVVTAAEAAEMWARHPSLVRRIVDDPRVISRRSGNVLLISYVSLVLVWGKPVSGLREFDQSTRENETTGDAKNETI